MWRASAAGPEAMTGRREGGGRLGIRIARLRPTINRSGRSDSDPVGRGVEAVGALDSFVRESTTRLPETFCHERTQAPVETVDNTGDSERDSAEVTCVRCGRPPGAERLGRTARRLNRSWRGGPGPPRHRTRGAGRLSCLTAAISACILGCPFCAQCRDGLIDGDACGNGPRPYRDK